jgi:hypothetical protein
MELGWTNVKRTKMRVCEKRSEKSEKKSEKSD